MLLIPQIVPKINIITATDSEVRKDIITPSSPQNLEVNIPETRAEIIKEIKENMSMLRVGSSPKAATIPMIRENIAIAIIENPRHIR